MTRPLLELSQQERYGAFYTRARRALSGLRFDVRYRQRRLHEVLSELSIDTEGKVVLDVGFGAGELLASFPESCRLVGVDVAESAVEAARRDARFARYAAADFHVVAEDDPRALPAVEADIVISSHMIEHARDDKALLRALRRRLRTGGVLALFVPIEEPDYILFHRRSYSLQSIAERVELAGFDLLRCEGSMYVNGHVWKWLTIPSRRRWPGVRHVADGVRVVTLGALPYTWLARVDRLLFACGVGARQALVIATKRAQPTRERAAGRADGAQV